MLLGLRFCYASCSRVCTHCSFYFTQGQGSAFLAWDTGESKEEVENSPFSEQLLEKGYEIIYFTDPVDEYVMQNLLEYDDMKFQSASTGDLTLGDKDTKKENKKLKVGHDTNLMHAWLSPC